MMWHGDHKVPILLCGYIYPHNTKATHNQDMFVGYGGREFGNVYMFHKCSMGLNLVNVRTNGVPGSQPSAPGNSYSGHLCTMEVVECFISLDPPPQKKTSLLPDMKSIKECKWPASRCVNVTPVKVDSSFINVSMTTHLTPSKDPLLFLLKNKTSG